MKATVSAIAQSLASIVFQETGMRWELSPLGSHELLLSLEDGGLSDGNFSGKEPRDCLSLDLPVHEHFCDLELASAAYAACRALQSFDLTETAVPPGSPFQRRVWAAMLSLPLGDTCTYSELATRIGATPASSRAVAQACGANRIALAIPCHRVVPAVGGPGGYRWGSRWKRALLDAERALVGLP